MSFTNYLYRFVVSNFLTLYYSITTLIFFAVTFIKNPFSDPWAIKLNLIPPAPLTDPKYGTHKYIKANNINIHYVESGDHSKPLMLFVHGFPEFWYSWRYQILEFQKDYWCIAVDMRGYADSEKLDGVSSYKMEYLVEDLRDLIRQLGREKCILVSHDWGGLICCRFRDVHPDALIGIVMLASASKEAWNHEVWHNEQQRKMSWYVFLYRAPILAERLLQMNNLEALRKFMLVPGKDTINEQDIDCYKYWFGKQHTLTPPINYYRANWAHTLPDKKTCDKNIPFLAVHAQNDNFLCHSILDRMKTEYNHIETDIIEDCAHFLQQEEPVKVNKRIREFLTKHKI